MATLKAKTSLDAGKKDRSPCIASSLSTAPDGEHPSREDEEEGRDARSSRIDGRGDEPPDVEVVPDERPRKGVLVVGEHAHDGAEQGPHHAHYQRPGDGRDASEQLLRAAPVPAADKPDRHGCATHTARRHKMKAARDDSQLKSNMSGRADLK